MKRKTAKEVLAESFQELAAKMPINKITVKNITDNCGYSPATFYRHFDDKYDMIAWNYARGIRKIMEQAGSEEMDWRCTLLEAARLFQNEKTYLANLLTHTSGHDSFTRYMTDINHEELMKYIKRSTGMKQFDQKTELCMRMYAMGTVSLSGEWILDKFDATVEELADIYESTMPEPLRKLLSQK